MGQKVQQLGDLFEARVQQTFASWRYVGNQYASPDFDAGSFHVEAKAAAMRCGVYIDRKQFKRHFQTEMVYLFGYHTCDSFTVGETVEFNPWFVVSKHFIAEHQDKSKPLHIKSELLELVVSSQREDYILSPSTVHTPGVVLHRHLDISASNYFLSRQ